MMSLALREFFLSPLDFCSLPLGAGADVDSDAGSGSFRAK